MSSVNANKEETLSEAMKTTIIIAIITISIACTIESQSSRTARQIPKPKVEQRPCKGKKCRISMTSPHGGRIIGGEEAIPHSWPWMAYIICDNELKESRCGGSLISDRWIITTAHCLILTEMDVLRDCKVMLGKHVLRIVEPTQLIPEITSYVFHEKYNISNPINGYDLGLIKFAQPVKFTSAIQPINLPFGRPELPYNKSCIATGWGDTKYGDNKPSEKLMQLSMTVMDEWFCGAIGRPADRVYCTVSWDPKKDLCNGDSGGPLACKEADGKWYLRAVTSMVKDKCVLEAYSTKVASFEDWIKNHMKHN